MKKIYTLLSILLLTVILTACGTSTTTEKQDSNTQETENAEVTTSPEVTENSEVDTTQAASPEKELEGTSTESDSNNYSITVLEGYELTAEEPNKDLLFNQENDLQSMRIETFSPEEITLEEIEENTMASLQASNESSTVTEITDDNMIPTHDSIQNVSAHQIDTTDGKVSGYVFERDGLLVKLTVFDTAATPALGKFVQMAETIKSK
ncbi:hypothetical protein SAMN05421670_1423 [Psychrobacillus psychrotolerans]|uniref:Lipoprotein n=1 Tax=Psychrobacillus psychrotolerans TaxID=126156 RepID=A0A1I5WSV8_9BACI|nr:hypothetical protein [Psychrobacillus psychrotolerans]SFQ22701.1 hypothetical protein SAMN05421670_1423 [Psychrobacillus psychrotolerans]